MKQLHTQLRTLAGATLVILFALVMVVNLGIERNRQAVRQAQLAQEAYADVLPPPLFLVELRVLAGDLARGVVSVEQARRERDRLVGSFTERVRYWGSLKNDDLSLMLLGEQRASALEMIRRFDALLAQAGTPTSVVEARQRLSTIDEAYRVHRARTLEASELARIYTQRSIERYERATTQLHVLALSVAALVAAGVVAVTASMAGKLKAEIGGEPQQIVMLASAVTHGHLGAHDIPDKGSRRGVMRAVVDMMRSTAQNVSRLRSAAQSIASSATRASTLVAQTLGSSHGAAQVLERAHEHAHSLSGQGEAALQGLQTIAQNAQTRLPQLESRRHELAVVTQQLTQAQQAAADAAAHAAAITEIARRTAILALNASVEAVRSAGANNGFKVVAKEIQSMSVTASASARAIHESTRRCQEGLATAAGKVGDFDVWLATSSQASVADAAAAEGLMALTQDHAARSQSIAQLLAQATHACQGEIQAIEQCAAALSDLDHHARQLTNTVGFYRGEERVLEAMG